MRLMPRFQLTSLFSLALLLSAALPATSQAAEPSPQAAKLAAWLEENIPLYMAESKMPGFSIAVVKDGQTIYAEGFGARDPKKNLPATPDTLFGIGSITKSMVAIGVMQLVEHGEIALDDPVSKHLPFKLGLPDHPITIHHLLTHSLGIPSLATSTVALYRGLGHETGVPLSSAGDFYRFMNGAENEIVAKPGERFFYHNAAWRMLAHIIQEKSGMPLDEYLKKKVIQPLGMERTTLSVKDFLADPNHITPHYKDSDGNQQATGFPYPDPGDNPDFAFLAGAGGVISSVNEMSRYMIAQIERGKFASGRLASKKSFGRMQKLQIRLPDGHFGRKGYGYGLFITPDFLGHKLVSHGGSIIVSTANMAIVPDIKAGVVMMGNSGGMPYSTISDSVLAILLDKEPAEVLPALQIKQRMDQLIGTYEVYRGLQRLEVFRRNGMLYLRTQSRLGGSSSVPLIPEDPSIKSTMFYTLSSGLKSPVEFRPSTDQPVELFLGRYCYRKVE